MGSLEGHLNLVLAARSLGGIGVQVEVIASHCFPRIALTFEIELDQSYLPKILSDSRRYFLAGDPNA